MAMRNNLEIKIFFLNMNMIFFNFIEKRDFIEIVENLCSLDKNQC